jgi:putative isomerase
MNYDLRQVPFSRFGSYLALSRPPRDRNPDGDLFIRTVHGNSFNPNLFAVRLVKDGRTVPFTETADAASVRLTARAGAGRSAPPCGTAEFCLADPKRLHVRSEGVAVRLVMATAMTDNAIPYGPNRWQVNRRSSLAKYMLHGLRGDFAVDAPWTGTACDHVVAEFIPGPDGRAEGILEEFFSTWTPHDRPADFDAARQAVSAEFAAWLKKMPPLAERHRSSRRRGATSASDPGPADSFSPPDLRAAWELAGYLLWSCGVPAGGHLTRPAILMSKNHMNRLWCWDYLFNALALAYRAPREAWDQFMLPFDIQDPTGSLPDFATDDLYQWNFVKPPIQGWALRWMLRRCGWLTPRHLKEAYAPLARLTDWWLAHRDTDGDGIPAYDHGNDSGWDNATCFDLRPPIEAPDLSAYLVLQMDVLAAIARKLGRSADSARWKARADALLRRLIDHSWRDGAFLAPSSGAHETASGDSLLAFLPLVLGARLPAGVRRRMLDGLTRPGRFLSPHGLATEALDSPKYQPDGYWRGPIWAPTTLMLLDGLQDLGRHDMARDLARRFCALCARAGFAENFDARTGAGLRDRAYTWTAAVFLCLGHEML